MSGGYWDYKNEYLKDDIFGYYETKIPNVLEDREVSELVFDVFTLLHEFDWYKCGDTSKETYLEKKKEFKKKWLGNNRGLRVKQTIDKAIEEVRQEMYETFGINN